jgi:hypothetical protein
MRSLLLVLFSVFSLHAQPQYAPGVPSPKSVLGYDLGDRYTSHAAIEGYIRALEAYGGGKVRFVTYGRTYEGRNLNLVVISAPENIRNLEAIRRDVARLADPRSTNDAEARQLVSATPAIAWLSYGVHGNEASSPEAALNVMYELAARTDTEITGLLSKLVVVIDPLLNPDGHERYVNYQVTRRGVRPVEDRNAVEHNEDAPSGRTNHYFFDLNRDWSWLTQGESRDRIAAYRQWKPQVHVDFHEMGYNSSYFFFPAFKPINKNFPASTVAWGNIYGLANAAAFDKEGWSYYSGESFDLFYPGYGDSWPSLNGAIGMTYEQAGQVGVRVKRSDETILTLKDRLLHHSATSLATLRTTAEHREERLRDFRAFFRDAIDEGTSGPVRAFLVPPGKDPSRSAKMIGRLMMQGVEVRTADKAFSMDGLSTYFTKGTSAVTFPAGTYIIPLAQPAKRLIMTLMEQDPVLSDTTFYDISTWALPVAYGVETYWTGKNVGASSTAVAEPALGRGSVAGGVATTAYLIPWTSNDAVKVLAALLQQDFKAEVSMQEFTLKGERFGRGTIVVPVNTNRPALHDSVRALAERFHITVTAAQSGYTEGGIDLGSDRVVRLKKPKVVVATNSPVGTESFGAIWSMFDQEYGIEFVPMKVSSLRFADLSPYTAIVFPDDNADGFGYRSALDSGAVARIKTWIAAGGTFIGIEGGAAFASADRGRICGLKLKDKEKEKENEKEKDDDKKKDDEKGKKKLSDEELEKRMTVEERERKQRLDEIPGTMLRVKLDPSHPLGFGYDGTIAVLKTSPTVFQLSDRGYNVGIYAASPRLSGYLSPENEKNIEDTPFLVHEQLGQGNIVLFADDPNFRLFWDSLNKVFLNSVLLMPSIRNVTLSAGQH